MDAPVDFSLDRARILNGNITPYNGSNFNDSGRSASVGGGGGCVQDLNRGSTTPSTSGDFHRYFHPAGVTLGPQGTSSNTRFLLPQDTNSFHIKYGKCTETMIFILNNAICFQVTCEEHINCFNLLTII